jgi:hypothetical protein
MMTIRRIALALTACAAFGTLSPALAKTAPGSGATAKLKSYDIEGSKVPASLRAAAEKQFECNAAVMTETPVTAYELSSERAIWEILCDRFAYQTSTVFALVSIKNPAQKPTFLRFAAPPRKTRGAPASIIMNANVDDETREISSANFERGLRDCGTYEVHRILPSGAVRLIEYREKARCNGRFTGPEEWPLIYKAK